MQRGGVKALIIILVLLIIVAGGVLAYKIMKDKNSADIEEVAVEEEKKENVEKQVQIFNRKR